MAHTSTRDKNDSDYWNSDQSSEENFGLIDNIDNNDEEALELPSEDQENSVISDDFAEILRRLLGNRQLVQSFSTELQVRPVGDSRVNRKPAVLVLRLEHLNQISSTKKNRILLSMPPPMFVAEVVGEGDEKSHNYRRDYEWKRQQYEGWQIPEYWIIDRYRQQVTVLVLMSGKYKEYLYRPTNVIQSAIFPAFTLSAGNLLSGNLF
ncbi:MAG: Uma2 family endonuclease [Cyanobacteria bacterium P01_F01_bin.150]